jgi:hypothetical protein
MRQIVPIIPWVPTVAGEEFPNWSVRLLDFPFPMPTPRRFRDCGEKLDFISAYAFIALPIRRALR